MSTRHKLDITEALQVKIIPQFPRRIVISWSIGKEVKIPLAFNIFRSGIDSGEFEKLNRAPITHPFYFDDGLKPLSKLFHVVYKLEVLFPFTDETQMTRPIPLVCSPRLARTFFVARRMDEKHGIEYASHTGIELVILKRKQWGEKCTECINEVTGSSTKTDCGNCFGTGFEGGFWKPYETLGKIDPLVKTQSLQDPLGYQENINTQIHLRAFPIVVDGDVIVEKCQNLRWYVQVVQLIEHGRYPVKQLVEGRQIERGSPIYEIPVEESEDGC